MFGNKSSQASEEVSIFIHNFGVQRARSKAERAVPPLIRLSLKANFGVAKFASIKTRFGSVRTKIQWIHTHCLRREKAKKSSRKFFSVKLSRS